MIEAEKPATCTLCGEDEAIVELVQSIVFRPLKERGEAMVSAVSGNLAGGDISMLLALCEGCVAAIATGDSEAIQGMLKALSQGARPRS